MAAIVLLSLLLAVQGKDEPKPVDVDEFFEKAYRTNVEATETPPPPKRVTMPTELPELPAKYRFEEKWQDGSKCGAVALYTMLALNGIRASFDDICQKLPDNKQGSSIAELQAAASQFGLNLRPVQVSIEQLKTLPMPCIVHWNIRGQDKDPTGHFDVLLEHVNGIGYSAINTTYCMKAQIAYQAVAPQFDGYVLITEARSSLLAKSLWICLGLVVAANLWYAGQLWRSRRGKSR